MLHGCSSPEGKPFVGQQVAQMFGGQAFEVAALLRGVSLSRVFSWLSSAVAVWNGLCEWTVSTCVPNFLFR